jgi:ABC-type polar amino acid transport system ATPase subunit
MLSGKALTKSFGNHCVLRGVDAEVELGGITAVVGPSGSGKTTLLKALALLEPPDDGKVILDGVEYDFPLLQGRVLVPPYPRLTVVFQQLFTWPHLTLRENIALPLRTLGRDPDGKQVRELITLFDMEDYLDRYPNQVSLGQRQRAALVRALALGPQYLLLDEVTSALDIEQVGVVLAHLQRLREQGVGILLVTHLIGFARRAADRVIFLDDGAVLEAGGPKILEHPSHPRLRKFLTMLQAAS